MTGTTAYFHDVTEEGAPWALWVSTLLLGIPTLLYSIIMISVVAGRLRFSGYLRAWIHVNRKRYFIHLVRSTRSRFFRHSYRPSNALLTHPITLCFHPYLTVLVCPCHNFSAPPQSHMWRMERYFICAFCLCFAAPFVSLAAWAAALAAASLPQYAAAVALAVVGALLLSLAAACFVDNAAACTVFGRVLAALGGVCIVGVFCFLAATTAGATFYARSVYCYTLSLLCTYLALRLDRVLSLPSPAPFLDVDLSAAEAELDLAVITASTYADRHSAYTTFNAATARRVAAAAVEQQGFGRWRALVLSLALSVGSVAALAGAVATVTLTLHSHWRRALAAAVVIAASDALIAWYSRRRALALATATAPSPPNGLALLACLALPRVLLLLLKDWFTATSITFLLLAVGVLYTDAALRIYPPAGAAAAAAAAVAAAGDATMLPGLSVAAVKSTPGATVSVLVAGPDPAAVAAARAHRRRLAEAGLGDGSGSSTCSESESESGSDSDTADAAADHNNSNNNSNNGKNGDTAATRAVSFANLDNSSRGKGDSSALVTSTATDADYDDTAAAGEDCDCACPCPACSGLVPGQLYTSGAVPAVSGSAATATAGAVTAGGPNSLSHSGRCAGCVRACGCQPCRRVARRRNLPSAPAVDALAPPPDSLPPADAGTAVGAVSAATARGRARDREQREQRLLTGDIDGDAAYAHARAQSPASTLHSRSVSRSVSRTAGPGAGGQSSSSAAAAARGHRRSGSLSAALALGGGGGLGSDIVFSRESALTALVAAAAASHPDAVTTRALAALAAAAARAPKGSSAPVGPVTVVYRDEPPEVDVADVSAMPASQSLASTKHGLLLLAGTPLTPAAPTAPAGGARPAAPGAAAPAYDTFPPSSCAVYGTAVTGVEATTARALAGVADRGAQPLGVTTFLATDGGGGGMGAGAAGAGGGGDTEAGSRAGYGMIDATGMSCAPVNPNAGVRAGLGASSNTGGAGNGEAAADAEAGGSKVNKRRRRGGGRGRRNRDRGGGGGGGDNTGDDDDDDDSDGDSAAATGTATGGSGGGGSGADLSSVMGSVGLVGALMGDALMSSAPSDAGTALQPRFGRYSSASEAWFADLITNGIGGALRGPRAAPASARLGAATAGGAGRRQLSRAVATAVAAADTRRGRRGFAARRAPALADVLAHVVTVSPADATGGAVTASYSARSTAAAATASALAELAAADAANAAAKQQQQQQQQLQQQRQSLFGALGAPGLSAQSPAAAPSANTNSAGSPATDGGKWCLGAAASAPQLTVADTLALALGWSPRERVVVSQRSFDVRAHAPTGAAAAAARAAAAAAAGAGSAFAGYEAFSPATAEAAADAERAGTLLTMAAAWDEDATLFQRIGPEAAAAKERADALVAAGPGGAAGKKALSRFRSAGAGESASGGGARGADTVLPLGTVRLAVAATVTFAAAILFYAAAALVRHRIGLGAPDDSSSNSSSASTTENSYAGTWAWWVMHSLVSHFAPTQSILVDISPAASPPPTPPQAVMVLIVAVLFVFFLRSLAIARQYHFLPAPAASRALWLGALPASLALAMLLWLLYARPLAAVMTLLLPTWLLLTVRTIARFGTLSVLRARVKAAARARISMQSSSSHGGDGSKAGAAAAAGSAMGVGSVPYGFITLSCLCGCRRSRARKRAQAAAAANAAASDEAESGWIPGQRTVVEISTLTTALTADSTGVLLTAGGGALSAGQANVRVTAVKITPPRTVNSAHLAAMTAAALTAANRQQRQQLQQQQLQTWDRSLAGPAAAQRALSSPGGDEATPESTAAALAGTAAAPQGLWVGRLVPTATAAQVRSGVVLRERSAATGARCVGTATVTTGVHKITVASPTPPYLHPLERAAVVSALQLTLLTVVLFPVLLYLATDPAADVLSWGLPAGTTLLSTQRGVLIDLLCSRAISIFFPFALIAIFLIVLAFYRYLSGRGHSTAAAATHDARAAADSAGATGGSSTGAGYGAAVATSASASTTAASQLAANSAGMRAAKRSIFALVLLLQIAALFAAAAMLAAIVGTNGFNGWTLEGTNADPYAGPFAAPDWGWHWLLWPWRLVGLDVFDAKTTVGKTSLSLMSLLSLNDSLNDYALYADVATAAIDAVSSTQSLETIVAPLASTTLSSVNTKVVWLSFPLAAPLLPLTTLLRPTPRLLLITLTFSLLPVAVVLFLFAWMEATAPENAATPAGKGRSSANTTTGAIAAGVGLGGGSGGGAAGSRWHPPSLWTTAVAFLTVTLLMLAVTAVPQLNPPIPLLLLVLAAVAVPVLSAAAQPIALALGHGCVRPSRVAIGLAIVMLSGAAAGLVAWAVLDIVLAGALIAFELCSIAVLCAVLAIALGRTLTMLPTAAVASGGSDDTAAAEQQLARANAKATAAAANAAAASSSSSASASAVQSSRVGSAGEHAGAESPFAAVTTTTTAVATNARSTARADASSGGSETAVSAVAAPKAASVFNELFYFGHLFFPVFRAFPLTTTASSAGAASAHDLRVSSGLFVPFFVFVGLLLLWSVVAAVLGVPRSALSVASIAHILAVTVCMEASARSREAFASLVPRLSPLTVRLAREGTLAVVASRHALVEARRTLAAQRTDARTRAEALSEVQRVSALATPHMRRLTVEAALQRSAAAAEAKPAAATSDARVVPLGASMTVVSDEKRVVPAQLPLQRLERLAREQKKELRALQQQAPVSIAGLPHSLKDELMAVRVRNRAVRAATITLQGAFAARRAHLQRHPRAAKLGSAAARAVGVPRAKGVAAASLSWAGRALSLLYASLPAAVDQAHSLRLLRSRAVAQFVFAVGHVTASRAVFDRRNYVLFTRWLRSARFTVLPRAAPNEELLAALSVDEAAQARRWLRAWWQRAEARSDDVLEERYIATVRDDRVRAGAAAAVGFADEITERDVAAVAAGGETAPDALDMLASVPPGAVAGSACTQAVATAVKRQLAAAVAVHGDFSLGADLDLDPVSARAAIAGDDGDIEIDGGSATADPAGPGAVQGSAAAADAAVITAFMAEAAASQARYEVDTTRDGTDEDSTRLEGETESAETVESARADLWARVHARVSDAAAARTERRHEIATHLGFYRALMLAQTLGDALPLARVLGLTVFDDNADAESIDPAATPVLATLRAMSAPAAAQRVFGSSVLARPLCRRLRLWSPGHRGAARRADVAALAADAALSGSGAQSIAEFATEPWVDESFPPVKATLLGKFFTPAPAAIIAHGAPAAAPSPAVAAGRFAAVPLDEPWRRAYSAGVRSGGAPPPRYPPWVVAPTLPFAPPPSVRSLAHAPPGLGALPTHCRVVWLRPCEYLALLPQSVFLKGTPGVAAVDQRAQFAAVATALQLGRLLKDSQVSDASESVSASHMAAALLLSAPVPMLPPGAPASLVGPISARSFSAAQVTAAATEAGVRLAAPQPGALPRAHLAARAWRAEDIVPSPAAASGAVASVLAALCARQAETERRAVFAPCYRAIANDDGDGRSSGEDDEEEDHDMHHSVERDAHDETDAIEASQVAQMQQRPRRRGRKMGLARLPDGAPAAMVSQQIATTALLPSALCAGVPVAAHLLSQSNDNVADASTSNDGRTRRLPRLLPCLLSEHSGMTVSTLAGAAAAARTVRLAGIEPALSAAADRTRRRGALASDPAEAVAQSCLDPAAAALASAAGAVAATALAAAGSADADGSSDLRNVGWRGSGGLAAAALRTVIGAESRVRSDVAVWKSEVEAGLRAADGDAVPVPEGLWAAAWEAAEMLVDAAREEFQRALTAAHVSAAAAKIAETKAAAGGADTAVAVSTGKSGAAGQSKSAKKAAKKAANATGAATATAAAAVTAAEQIDIPPAGVRLLARALTALIVGDGDCSGVANDLAATAPPVPAPAPRAAAQAAAQAAMLGGGLGGVVEQQLYLLTRALVDESISLEWRQRRALRLVYAAAARLLPLTPSATSTTAASSARVAAASASADGGVSESGTEGADVTGRYVPPAPQWVSPHAFVLQPMPTSVWLPPAPDAPSTVPAPASAVPPRWDAPRTATMFGSSGLMRSLPLRPSALARGVPAAAVLRRRGYVAGAYAACPLTPLGDDIRHWISDSESDDDDGGNRDNRTAAARSMPTGPIPSVGPGTVNTHALTVLRAEWRQWARAARDTAATSGASARVALPPAPPTPLQVATGLALREGIVQRFVQEAIHAAAATLLPPSAGPAAAVLPSSTTAVAAEAATAVTLAAATAAAASSSASWSSSSSSQSARLNTGAGAVTGAAVVAGSGTGAVCVRLWRDGAPVDVWVDDRLPFLQTVTEEEALWAARGPAAAARSAAVQRRARKRDHNGGGNNSKQAQRRAQAAAAAAAADGPIVRDAHDDSDDDGDDEADRARRADAAFVAAGTAAAAAAVAAGNPFTSLPADGAGIAGAAHTSGSGGFDFGARARALWPSTTETPARELDAPTSRLNGFGAAWATVTGLVPAFTHARDPCDVWPALVEKALAKLWSSHDATAAATAAGEAAAAAAAEQGFSAEEAAAAVAEAQASVTVHGGYDVLEGLSPRPALEALCRSAPGTVALDTAAALAEARSGGSGGAVATTTSMDEAWRLVSRVVGEAGAIGGGSTGPGGGSGSGIALVYSVDTQTVATRQRQMRAVPRGNAHTEPLTAPEPGISAAAVPVPFRVSTASTASESGFALAAPTPFIVLETAVFAASDADADADLRGGVQIADDAADTDATAAAPGAGAAGASGVDQPQRLQRMVRLRSVGQPVLWPGAVTQSAASHGRGRASTVAATALALANNHGAAAVAATAAAGSDAAAGQAGTGSSAQGAASSAGGQTNAVTSGAALSSQLLPSQLTAAAGLSVAGAFWMPFEDFLLHFSDLHFVTAPSQQPTWCVRRVHSAWHPLPSPNPADPPVVGFSWDLTAAPQMLLTVPSSRSLRCNAEARLCVAGAALLLAGLQNPSPRAARAPQLTSASNGAGNNERSLAALQSAVAAEGELAQLLHSLSSRSVVSTLSRNGASGALGDRVGSRDEALLLASFKSSLRSARTSSAQRLLWSRSTAAGASPSLEARLLAAAAAASALGAAERALRGFLGAARATALRSAVTDTLAARHAAVSALAAPASVTVAAAASAATAAAVSAAAKAPLRSSERAATSAIVREDTTAAAAAGTGMAGARETCVVHVELEQQEDPDDHYPAITVFLVAPDGVARRVPLAAVRRGRVDEPGADVPRDEDGLPTRAGHRRAATVADLEAAVLPVPQGFVRARTVAGSVLVAADVEYTVVPCILAPAATSGTSPAPVQEDEDGPKPVPPVLFQLRVACHMELELRELAAGE